MRRNPQDQFVGEVISKHAPNFAVNDTSTPGNFLKASNSSRRVQSTHHNVMNCLFHVARGAPCILQTANTANNRGRKFYSCQSQKCNFFVWEDINKVTGGNVQPGRTSVSASNTSRSGGRGRGGRGGARAATAIFVSATGDPVTGRRCFVCGDPSQFANVCPNRGS